MRKNYIPIVSQNLAQSTQCKACGSTEFVTTEYSDTVHHASLSCGACGKFQKWIEKPSNIERREAEDRLIADLLMCDRLNGWERMFIRSVRDTKKRSPRQREKLRQIAERLGFVNLRVCEGGAK